MPQQTELPLGKRGLLELVVDACYFADMQSSKDQRWIVGVTGASGIRYAVRLLQVLPSLVDEVHVVISESALRVLSDEEGISIGQSSLSYERLCNSQASNVTFYNPKDIGARIASGSMVTNGMVVIPCSMATLGALAHGVPTHLVHRAADVVMKEGRKLIVVPRETPLSPIHLENMLTLSRYGVRVLPAMPAFYSQPKTIDDLINHMVMKVLDTMGIPNSLVGRWKEPSGEE
jgi:4-hydroxy-3-polyprenylbenzoate decarboxylase